MWDGGSLSRSTGNLTDNATENIAKISENIWHQKSQYFQNLTDPRYERNCLQTRLATCGSKSGWSVLQVFTCCLWALRGVNKITCIVLLPIGYQCVPWLWQSFNMVTRFVNGTVATHSAGIVEWVLSASDVLGPESRAALELLCFG